MLKSVSIRAAVMLDSTVEGCLGLESKDVIFKTGVLRKGEKV